MIRKIVLFPFRTILLVIDIVSVAMISVFCYVFLTDERNRMNKLRSERHD
jgi:hypothetical protein